MRKLLESKLRELRPDKIIGLKPPIQALPAPKKLSPSSSMSGSASGSSTAKPRSKSKANRAEMWAALIQAAAAATKKEAAVTTSNENVVAAVSSEDNKDDISSSTPSSPSSPVPGFAVSALALSLSQSLIERFNPTILGMELMTDTFAVGDEAVVNNTWNRVTIRFEEQLAREQKEEEEKAVVDQRNVGEPSSARNEDDDDDDATVESAEAEYSGQTRGTEALEITSSDSAQADPKEKDPEKERENSAIRNPGDVLPDEATPDVTS